MIFEIKGKKIEVKALNRNELNSHLIQQWGDLEDRSIEGNAYLSPHFVLPAITYLTPNAEVIFVFITHLVGNTSFLTGVGIFEYSYGTKRVPFPHLRAYRSPHSYLTGLLVDKEFVDSTLVAFFSFFRNFKHLCFGVDFMRRTGDTKLAKKIEHVISQLAIPWYQFSSKPRAVLIPGKIDSGYLETMLSSNMKKKLRRCKKILAEAGTVRWQMVNGAQLGAECIDRFLHLEHMSWKGVQGTSLLSHKNDEVFFREVIAGFARKGRAFFTELKVGEQVISTTSNLISAEVGYAFKIGWDPDFAQASPGILNEIELIKNARELFPDQEYVDSGTEEGSYLDKLWPDRYTLVSGFFLTKPFVKPVAACLDFARSVIHRCRKPMPQIGEVMVV